MTIVIDEKQADDLILKNDKNDIKKFNLKAIRD
jgi:hypothetical protein